jgi:AraC-like DNA-binding protein
VVAHLTELIELSLLASGSCALPVRDPGVRAARLTAIKADIGRHLTDSSLSVAALAARHGITPRYLHMLFEDDAMSYSQYVLDQRLVLACRRLRDPRLAGRTISSIAHDAGFGDLSYFNRTFRRRYGVTPSAARVSRLPRRDVADVHHHPVRAGQGGDVVRPPSVQIGTQIVISCDLDHDDP